MREQDGVHLLHGAVRLRFVVFAVVAVIPVAAVDQKRSLRHSNSPSSGVALPAVRGAVTDKAEEYSPSQLRSLWPLTAVVLTARELEPSGRVRHLRDQLESRSIPFRVEEGDYAGRYSSLLDQFEELSVDPHVRSDWVAGRAQNDLLAEDLIGNADVFCDVAACLQQPHCVCVREPQALPADSLLSITTTHRRAWKSVADDAAHDENSWHLVLEDDAELVPSTSADYFSNFSVPAEADLVWLYRGNYQHRCWGHKGEENTLMSGPVFDTSDYNAVAYAITKAGARRLLRHVPQDGSPVDMAMSRAVGSCGLKAFCPPSGRYPVTDSKFQGTTTRLALSTQNFELDGMPPKPSSFLQLTPAGHAAGLRQQSSPTASRLQMPRRLVQCSPSEQSG